jgi:FixJ family two-component response regulator
MTNRQPDLSGPASNGIIVSLVNGEPSVRHARQIMLRSENYDVRSYATCAALLADPRSRDCPCIVVDVEMESGDGMSLLREMRATGWRGKAVLLYGDQPASKLLEDAERQGDTLFAQTIADRILVAAIAATADRGRIGEI